jgi:putative endonuclease
LVERLNGIQEVAGSNPVGSTILRSEPAGFERRMVSSEAAFERRRTLFAAIGSELRMAGLFFRLMFYAYILESLQVPGEFYRGHTSDLKQRLIDHNAGCCSHTIKFRPWKVKFYAGFETLEDARNFEMYLKSGSGHAFANRHFGL